MSAGVIGAVIGLLIGGFAGFVFGWNVCWDDQLAEACRTLIALAEQPDKWELKEE